MVCCTENEHRTARSGRKCSRAGTLRGSRLKPTWVIGRRFESAGPSAPCAVPADASPRRLSRVWYESARSVLFESRDQLGCGNIP